MTQFYPTDDPITRNTPIQPNDMLIVDSLRTYFPVKGGLLGRTVAQAKAIDGICFSVRRGETFGIVGEAGAGKTSLARTLLRLTPATDGSITFEGTDVGTASGAHLQTLRRDIQLIWSDPHAALDPRWPVGDSVAEGLQLNNIGSHEEQQRRVRRAMAGVGVPSTLSHRLPSELPTTQLGRLGVARALMLEPKLIVADDPASKLDLTGQAQMVRLLKQLQRELDLTYLFMAQNLGTVAQISDRIAVLYLGWIAELAPRDELLRNPLHPYTKALISALPVPDPNVRRERIVLRGDMPSAINPPSGCRFHTRCWLAKDICKTVDPPLEEKVPGHWAACHFADGVQN